MCAVGARSSGSSGSHAATAGGRVQSVAASEGTLPTGHPRRGRGDGGPGRLAPRGDAEVSRAAGYVPWKAARARPKSPAGDAGGSARPRPLRAYRRRTPLRRVGFPGRLRGRRALASISFPARCVPSCGGHGEEKPIPGWDSTLKKQYFPPPVAGTCQSGLPPPPMRLPGNFHSLPKLEREKD